MSRNSDKGDDEIWIVYDGECPFCTRYVMLYRIREHIKRLHLINARERHPIVEDLKNRDFDLDNGMVVVWSGIYYHGADAINILAMLGSDKGIFNFINKYLFMSPRISKIIYPILVIGRGITLKLLGRRLIGMSPQARKG